MVQLNAFSPDLRDAVAELLVDIGAQCDGLRCDMAMLMTNEVFARTWGDASRPGRGVLAGGHRPRRSGRTPSSCSSPRPTGTWSGRCSSRASTSATTSASTTGSSHDGADAVRGHLQADAGLPGAAAALHREPRRAARGAPFGPAQARAAAVVISTLPGARLFHDGQLEGQRTQIPVFLGRGPDEPPDEDLRAFYAGCCRAVAELSGSWRLLDSEAPLVAWAWDDDDVVVNLSDSPPAVSALGLQTAIRITRAATALYGG